MKAMNDLSKNELISLLYNNFDVDTNEEVCECAACGQEPNAKFGYICDRCEEEGERNGSKI